MWNCFSIWKNPSPAICATSGPHDWATWPYIWGLTPVKNRFPAICVVTVQIIRQIWNLIFEIFMIKQYHTKNDNSNKPSFWSLFNKVYWMQGYFLIEPIRLISLLSIPILFQYQKVSSISNLKPHACHFCDFRFSKIQSLQTHMRIHTGEKPFACHLCQYRSNQLGNLKGHLRRIHKI